MLTTRSLTAALLAAALLAGCGERTRAGAAADATAIPAGFPLAAGMGGARTARGGDAETLGHLSALELCGETPLADLDARDRMAADNSGGEAADTRDLVLMETVDDAAAAAEAARSAAAACPEHSAGDSVTTTRVHPSPFGADGPFAILRTFEIGGRTSPGVMVHHVVPEGNALLVTSTYGEWPGATTGIPETATKLAETVAALPTLVSPHPEPVPGDPAASGPAAQLPADLDLMVGLPEDGGDYRVRSQRPGGRMLGPVVLCEGHVWPTPEARHAQRLSTRVIGPEHFEGREAVAFQDEAAALRAVAAFRQAVGTCRRSTTVLVHQLEQDTGHDSVTAGMTYTNGPGSTVLQMTRVGSVVLFVTTYAEGTIDYLPRQAAEATRTTREIVGQL